MIEASALKDRQSSTNKKLLIFGGSPNRMEEVKLFLSQLEGLEIIGAFSEEEGMQIFKTTADINMVLIGGRYTEAQRIRIKKLIGNIKITEPGIAYPYSNENIFLHVKNLLI